jgi:hypothetical protein
MDAQMYKYEIGVRDNKIAQLQAELDKAREEKDSLDRQLCKAEIERDYFDGELRKTKKSSSGPADPELVKALKDEVMIQRSIHEKTLSRLLTRTMEQKKATQKVADENAALKKEVWRYECFIHGKNANMDVVLKWKSSFEDIPPKPVPEPSPVAMASDYSKVYYPPVEWTSAPKDVPVEDEHYNPIIGVPHENYRPTHNTPIKKTKLSCDNAFDFIDGKQSIHHSALHDMVGEGGSMDFDEDMKAEFYDSEDDEDMKAAINLSLKDK